MRGLDSGGGKTNGFPAVSGSSGGVSEFQYLYWNFTASNFSRFHTNAPNFTSLQMGSGAFQQIMQFQSTLQNTQLTITLPDNTITGVGGNNGIKFLPAFADVSGGSADTHVMKIGFHCFKSGDSLDVPVSSYNDKIISWTTPGTVNTLFYPVQSWSYQVPSGESIAGTERKLIISLEREDNESGDPAFLDITIGIPIQLM